MVGVVPRQLFKERAAVRRRPLYTASCGTLSTTFQMVNSGEAGVAGAPGVC